MEWVETTGKTIAEAKETALDELGVDEQDAEFEVLEEPKLGLFGRLRSEGRIRARVRPTTPRAKDDRRDRRRRSKGNDAKASEAATARRSSVASGPGPPVTYRPGGERPDPGERRRDAGIVGDIRDLRLGPTPHQPVTPSRWTGRDPARRRWHHDPAGGRAGGGGR
jgi:hypothetical protein